MPTDSTELRGAPADVPVRSNTAIEDFFDHFERALTSGDAHVIASLWETPAFVLADQMGRAVTSPDEVEAFFSGVKEQYAKRGIIEARAEIVRAEWVTDRIVIAQVRWPYIDEHGEEIGEESSTYTLRRDDRDNLKLRCVVMHGARTVH
jgi:hypothetical protein